MADPLEFANGILQGLSDVSEPVAVLWSGGKASTLIWELARAHISTPHIVYIDHGLHTPETIKLLHGLTRAGSFQLKQIKFYRNDPALLAIRSGELHLSLLPPEEREWARSLTSRESIPYTLSHPLVRHLLVEVPMNRIYQDYHWVVTGERAGRRPQNAYSPPFEVRGTTIILRPLWWFSEEELWQVLRESKIDVNDRYGMGYRTVDDVGDPEPADRTPAWEKAGQGPEGAITLPSSPIEGIAEQAVSMAEPSRTEFITAQATKAGLDPEAIKAEVKRILSSLKGGDRFGWKPPT
jgi:3'-phosphoadenosine 5'-phosphosulfate sulfotransferase (PAPS reductase)/FAD synthetase